MLEPLTDADAAEVVANALGNTGIPDSVRERVVRAAEGNPLFVEQLISMLVDSGQLHRVGDDWVAAADLNELAVPPTIQALLAARLDLLAREERAVIEPASVAGVEFAMDAVMALVPEALAEQVAGAPPGHRAQAAHPHRPVGFVRRGRLSLPPRSDQGGRLPEPPPNGHVRSYTSDS